MKPPSRRLTPILGFAVLLLAVVTVFVTVLERRFASGDIYPLYSTERSDPLGASALFDSFDALPGYEVTRNHRNLQAIDTLDHRSALWLCGVSRTSFEGLRGPEDSPVLRAIQEEGARLILTINPELVPEKFDLHSEEDDDWFKRREEARKQRDAESGKETPEKEEETKDDEIDDEEDPAMRGPALTELWEVKLDSPENFERPEEGWAVKAGRGLDPERPVPAALPRWRSQFHFDSLGADWRIAATVDERPVVIERSFGKGSVVLVSDSYFASNEALWQGAEPAFLLWLGGGKTRLIFDETIHGSVESGGVMKMIRRYRFHGFFFGLFVFIALLAWKSASSLAPGSEALERGLISGSGDAIAGEDTGSGFIRLLRRSVPRPRLLHTCLDTWRQTAGRRMRGESAGQREAIDRILRHHEAAPKDLPAAEAYAQISHVLAHPDAYRERPPSEKPA